MATKTVKTVKAIRDDAGARAAMSIVGKPLKAVNSALDDIAASTSSGKAQRDTCAGFYAWGVGFKRDTGKAEFDEKQFNDRFDAYAAKHWAPHEMPGDASMKGYRSQYRAFAEAAWCKFDAREAVQENLAIANVQMPWRAARMRDVIKLDAKPGKPELAKLFRITEAAGGGSALANGETLIDRFVSAGITLAGNAKVKAHLKRNPHVAEWLSPILQDLIKVRKMDNGAMKRPTVKDAVKAAETNFPVVASRGSKRPNVAAVGRA